MAALLATNSHRALRKRMMLEFLDRSYEVLITAREREKLQSEEVCRLLRCLKVMERTGNECVHHYNKSDKGDTEP